MAGKGGTTTTKGSGRGRSTAANLAIAAVMTSFSALGLTYMRLKPVSFGLTDLFDKHLAVGLFPRSSSASTSFLPPQPQLPVPIRRTFTGVGAVDGTLQFLVLAFASGAAGWDAPFYWQQLHFIGGYAGVLGVVTVESMRSAGGGGWAWTVASYTSIWAIFYQTTGGAIILPLYFAAHLLATSPASHFAPASRAVPLARARALLPALVLAYLVPTALMYAPLPGDAADARARFPRKQALIAFWQPSPVYLNLLTMGLALALPGAAAPPAAAEGKGKGKTAARTPADVPHLRRLYAVSVAVSAAVHVGVLGYLFSAADPALGLRNVFVPAEETLRRRELVSTLRYMFQVDFFGIWGSALAWSGFAAWDLVRLEKAQVGEVGRAIGGMIVGAVCFGPGAAIPAIWWWREERLAA